MISITEPELGTYGAGLARPECVLTTAAGEVYASDRLGAVARVRPEGPPERLVSALPDGFLANGVALRPDGSFLVANLGDGGGVWAVSRRGELAPFLREVEGVALPPTNFVGLDEAGRVWISVSTRRVPREQSFRREVADGFVVLVDHRGARVVADGLGFTNEAKVHPGGEWLYVNETIARRLSRFRLHPDGGLGPRETVAEFGAGTFPDGFEFDEEGGVWVASVVSNRVLRVDPLGGVHTVLEDADPEAVERAEEHYRAGTLGRADIDAGAARPLGNVSSVAFGGPDRRTVFLGSLFADRLRTFRSPVAGARPPHWEY